MGKKKNTKKKNTMPYVPGLKTTPPAQDRYILDPLVEQIAEETALRISNNFSVIREYKRVFWGISKILRALAAGKRLPATRVTKTNLLARAIFNIGQKYNYEGAFLGELNYAMTRFIQRVPGIVVERGLWKDEFRYWLYGATVEALLFVSYKTIGWGIGIGGVFADVKDEYKWKVNRAYEAAQIVKSGDCYDTPYYTRLVEVVDGFGVHVGYVDILLKRSPETVAIDILPLKIVLS